MLNSVQELFEDIRQHRERAGKKQAKLFQLVKSLKIDQIDHKKIRDTLSIGIEVTV